MIAEPLAVSGWYHDPAGRHDSRFWSGSHWTEAVRNGNQESTDRLIPVLAEPNTSAAWLDNESWKEWEEPTEVVQPGAHPIASPTSIPSLATRSSRENALPVEAMLTREPDNIHDRYACRVTIDGMYVGHLPRRLTPTAAQQMDESNQKSWMVCGLATELTSSHWRVKIWLSRRRSTGPAWPHCDKPALFPATGFPPAIALRKPYVVPYTYAVHAALTALRVPLITGGKRSDDQLVVIDKDSSELPDESEALMVSAYIAYKRSWSSPSQQTKMLQTPFDTKPGFDTIELYKHGPNSWAFRRVSWSGKWPPQTGRTRRNSLIDVLDSEQSQGEGPAPEWIAWKASRPEIFP